MIIVDINHEQYITLRLALSDAIADYRRQAKLFGDECPEDLYASHMEVLAKQCDEILGALYEATEFYPQPSKAFYADDFSNEGSCVEDWQEGIPC